MAGAIPHKHAASDCQSSDTICYATGKRHFLSAVRQEAVQLTTAYYSYFGKQRLESKGAIFSTIPTAHIADSSYNGSHFGRNHSIKYVNNPRNRQLVCLVIGIESEHMTRPYKSKRDNVCINS